MSPLSAAATPALELRVNGSDRRVSCDPDQPLLGVLRDDLDLTGAKYGCGEGRCGACTVLVDGKAVRSCVTPAGECAGRAVATIEGLEQNGRLHPVQEAILQEGALQCGYCTPGMIMAAVALLSKQPDPTPQDVYRALQGNVCRCGTYARIVRAVCAAARVMRGGGR
jgi:aerobic-type carbon monoxide dehydrogenase small subunit (CoxS/CutS family)